MTAPGLTLGFASAPNFRDLGGYRTGDDRLVRRGLVFRSDQLHPVSAGDLKAMAALGLVQVFDLRTTDERAARPDQVPPGVAVIPLDVLADAGPAGADALGTLFRDPAAANAALADGKLRALFGQTYRQFVALPSARSAYRRLFASLAAPAGLPALFHCTTGKDRTGWAAAALLAFLGVPRDGVEADYLRSNDYVPPRYQPVMDRIVAAGVERSIVSAIFEVRREYLAAAFDEVAERHGSMDAYFADGLGLDETARDALRDICLEPSR